MERRKQSPLAKQKLQSSLTGDDESVSLQEKIKSRLERKRA